MGKDDLISFKSIRRFYVGPLDGRKGFSKATEKGNPFQAAATTPCPCASLVCVLCNATLGGGGGGKWKPIYPVCKYVRVFKENTRVSVSVDIYISVRACICRENDNAPL